MNVLGVIPARGGSKGIPNKNLAPLCGRPLLAYTADAAKASTKLTHTIVSTDDERIAACAKSLGLEVLLRPSPLAADDTPMLPVLQHALTAMREQGFNADILVLLQPTSPLRRAEHIDTAVDWLQRVRGDSVVSVVEVPHQFNPTSVMRLDDGLLKPFLDGPTATRRQDKPRFYARNGPAVLAVHARVIEGGSLYGNETWPLVMTPEESLDVDTPWDLKLIEHSLQTRL
ncbi:MAG: acylneuraminate cytidylyltransferase [Acidobacteria bacterium]|nr:MAG: acylneuraminate cytidylyltransferase [Acidobacteriota bacterium]